MGRAPAGAVRRGARRHRGRGAGAGTGLRPQITLFADRFATARAAGQIDGSVGDVEAFELVVAPVFHRWQLRTGVLDHAYGDAVVRRACRALAP